jgi:hypothetical protein
MVLLEWQLSDYVASCCPNFGLQGIRGREDEVVDCHGSTECIEIDIHLLLFLFFLPFKESEPASGMFPPLLSSLSCIGRGLQKFRFNVSAVNSKIIGISTYEPHIRSIPASSLAHLA